MLARRVVNVLGAWLKILHAHFARDWLSTSLLQILDTPLPWAQSLMRRMKFVKRQGSTQAKAKLSDADIAKLRKSYLLQIKGMVDAHKIPSQLVINWDQAGVKLVPSSNWTLEQEGAERVEITGLNDKQPHLQVHSQGTYFHCKSCTKERLRGAILPRRSLMVSTYGIRQTIGPIKKPHFDSSRMSFYHTCAREIIHS